MDYGRFICPYCQTKVPKTHAVQFTCGRQKCRSARYNELKDTGSGELAPDTFFSALGVEILIDLMERKGLSEKEAATVMNKDYGAVCEKVVKLKETGAYGAVWKRIQIMRRLRS